MAHRRENRRSRHDTIGCGEERVAVRRRPSDVPCADRSGCPGLGFDDERLPQCDRQLLRHKAHDDLGRVSGAQRNDDTNGSGRVGVRGCRRWRLRWRLKRSQAPKQAARNQQRAADLSKDEFVGERSDATWRDMMSPV